MATVTSSRKRDEKLLGISRDLNVFHPSTSAANEDYFTSNKAASEFLQLFDMWCPTKNLGISNNIAGFW